MANINKGTAFSNGEQLSASKLNDLVDGATFGTDSVDNSTTLVNANGAITVRDSGITAAKLTANSVTTAKILDANVTTAKIADANVTFAKLTDVIDDDTMATATATNLATSESIKAYVDSSAAVFVPATYAGEESVTLPNGLIMKMGYSAGSAGTVTFSTAFTTSLLSVCITIKDTAAQSTNATVTADSSTAFTYTSAGGTTGVFWQAIGY